jgi:hypothetical protein
MISVRQVAVVEMLATKRGARRAKSCCQEETAYRHDRATGRHPPPTMRQVDTMISTALSVNREAHGLSMRPSDSFRSFPLNAMRPSWNGGSYCRPNPSLTTGDL